MKTHAKKCAYANRPTFEGHVECDCDGYHTFNELYDHRIALFIALAHRCESWAWKSRLHSDGSAMEGWFVMGLHASVGKQITYHLPNAKWSETNFAMLLDRAPEFDGHTSDDVIKRLGKI